MKPQFTREQIENHPLISPAYKKEMLSALDEHEASVNRRVRRAMYIIVAVVGILSVSLALTSCADPEKEAFEARQADLNRRIDSLEQARLTDGWEDEKQEQELRDFNSAQIDKQILRDQQK